jgi:phosphoenolpyruvate synthase/pyruvate phosphate dikinase
VTAALEDVQGVIGRTFGDPAEPLLFSVRSGAKFSMPGMMDTVLNIGLNDERSRAWRASPTTSASRGLLPPPHPDVLQDRARRGR